MLSGQSDNSRSLLRPYPNRTSTADECERIVTDDLAVLDRELDRRLRERPCISKFISYAKNHACHVDPVRHDLVVVRSNNNLLIDSLRRHFPFDHFLAADVSLDPQVLPTFANRGREINRKRRV